MSFRILSLEWNEPHIKLYSSPCETSFFECDHVDKSYSSPLILFLHIECQKNLKVQNINVNYIFFSISLFLMSLLHLQYFVLKK